MCLQALCACVLCLPTSEHLCVLLCLCVGCVCMCIGVPVQGCRLITVSLKKRIVQFGLGDINCFNMVKP